MLVFAAFGSTDFYTLSGFTIHIPPPTVTVQGIKVASKLLAATEGSGCSALSIHLGPVGY
jgi:hypothetical protein